MYRIKKWILRFLKSKGYLLEKARPHNGVEVDPLYFVAGFFWKMSSEGCIVQIGANDGVTNDPVRKIILDFHIPSVLVEPQPNVFQKLKRSYADVEGVYLENCAVDSSDGFRKMYLIDPNASGYPPWATGIASFDKSIIMRHKRVFPDLESDLISYDVPVLSFGSMVAKYDIKKIFLLQIDTEGFDFELVKQVLSTGVFPRIIQYEHKHLSIRDQFLCRDMLDKLGYSFITKSFDTIALFKHRL